jgi:hypothetical protein
LYVGGDIGSAGGISTLAIAAWNGASWENVGVGQLFNGLNAPVSALVGHDDGTGMKLYAGGQFNTSSSGNISAHIAKWNGGSWSSVGTVGTEGGFSFNAVVALASYDDGTGPNLFMGGPFETVGGVVAHHVARWNGVAWSKLGSGIDGGPQDGVFSTIVWDDRRGGGPALYVGGAFGMIGNTVVNCIAKWNGSTWTPLGPANNPGFNGRVAAMCIYDDGLGGGPALYLAGDFTNAGGMPVNHIARWNGFSWSALGSGLDGGVGALVVHDDGAGRGSSLYVGGGFGSAGGQGASRIARWDGSSWSPLGTGMSNFLVRRRTVPACRWRGRGQHRALGRQHLGAGWIRDRVRGGWRRVRAQSLR